MKCHCEPWSWVELSIFRICHLPAVDTAGRWYGQIRHAAGMPSDPRQAWDGGVDWGACGSTSSRPFVEFGMGSVQHVADLLQMELACVQWADWYANYCFYGSTCFFCGVGFFVLVFLLLLIPLTTVAFLPVLTKRQIDWFNVFFSCYENFSLSF